LQLLAPSQTVVCRVRQRIAGTPGPRLPNPVSTPTDTYCARLAKAIPPEHFAELFGEQLTLFTTPPEEIEPLVVVKNMLDDLEGRMT
jgi:hypothetical protein